jgi:hypothetical protein
MIHLKKLILVTIASAATTFAFAQTTPAESDKAADKTAPRAASSPHQRQTTTTSAAEQPANQETQPSSSSSPHQRQTAETANAKGAQQDQMMSDCINRQQKADSNLSKDQAKRTCMDQMKKAETPAG